MAYNLDGFLNGFTDNSPSHYSEEQIEKARKMQKKNGLTFMENLKLIAPEVTNGPSKSSSMPQSPEEISSIIKDLNTNIKNDTDIKTDTLTPKSVVNEENDSKNALDGFKGITDVVKTKIHGQDEYVKKLVIAFKRPFVMERDENDALNTIFLTGPDCTGKHYSLDILLTELKNRGVLTSDAVKVMNLSLYPEATDETLFIQDLYSALSSESSVVLFENYEGCHISLLTKISDLVTTGECRLSDRYVMKNGQLISVSNSLAGDTIGSLMAHGKYLLFISDKSVDKLASSLGAPFVNAIGDICETVSFDETTLKDIVKEQLDILVNKGKKQLFFNISFDDDFTDYIISFSGKGKGLRGILRGCDEVLKALSELRLERDDLPSDDVLLTILDGQCIVKVGDENISLSGLLPEGYSGELEAINKEIEKIVGLDAVKEYIFSLKEYYGVQRARREAGLKAGEVNKHMIFTGNPGTGKTTIARIVSKYLKAIGVLTGGQLVEVSRADLVGRYVGHTAPLVNQVIKSAIGGVLFIDEAYSLYRGKDDNFGLEAIDTLVKGIEDHRDDLVVILAGYSNEMEEFLEANSGLKSRFPNIIDFPDYTADELLKIAHITADSKGYKIDSEAEDELLEFFEMVQNTNPREAGNGRLVRNKIEEAILNQSRRLVAEPESDLSLLLTGDFEFEFKG